MLIGAGYLAVVTAMVAGIVVVDWFEVASALLALIIVVGSAVGAAVVGAWTATAG